MNQADSEKVHMLLLQSGFLRAENIFSADVVIFNTCSVRQKGEDRVFGMLHEIEKYNEIHEKKIIAGITGCMVRKTWLAKRYIEKKVREPWEMKKKAKKIELLWDNTQGIFNFDDDLFRRTGILDFTLRIEEIKFLPFILTEIYREKIGQEDKFDDYLKQVQQRENPFSASVIIQTGCDNYCTFCIVPYTRGSEISRNKDDIITECREAVLAGAKEITLLGQNVNSYGKQRNLKLWNNEKSKWNIQERKLKIGIDLDDTLFVVLWEELLMCYNKKFRDIICMDDITTFNCGGIEWLMQEYHIFETQNAQNLKLHTGAREVLHKLHQDWHTFYAITSRELHAKKDTYIILEKYFGKDFFREIIFIKEKGHDHKYIAANERELDIVIDDGPHHIEAYKQNYTGKICIFHAPWNRELKEDNSQVFRIYDWYDFENILPKLVFQSPFRELLYDINRIEWLERIRFTSSNPHDMTLDILDAHFELEHTCNYLHFALQSGSNEMLKRMNRRHNYEDFRDMVYYLRSKDPLFSISTDIIVGFSGETQEMFEQTLKAIEECEFDYCYTARYSVRPNTLAAKVLPDDVPESVKALRWHKINEVLAQVIQKRNSLMIGRTEKVLISWVKDEYFYGRTENFKEVFFEAKNEVPKIWDIVNIYIENIDRYVLLGKQV
jgi:tRNA A37 methylthiotransferase MiaB/5'(3')-deoxyribonucleotidase